MSIKSFLMSTALRAKGVSKDQAEALAEKLEVSPQYINKILKGQENLS